MTFKETSNRIKELEAKGFKATNEEIHELIYHY